MTDKYENPTSDDYMGVVMGIIMSGGNAKGLTFKPFNKLKMENLQKQKAH